MSQKKQIHIAIAWKWFPFYAAKLIGESSLARGDYTVTLLGTKSARRFGDLSEVAKHPIHWLEDGGSYSWEQLGLKPPDLLIFTGWAEESFLSLAYDARKTGTRCISMVDNRWRGDVRQYLGAVIFRFRYRPLFDGVWVPGLSGVRLMRFFGMLPKQIWTGLYGADNQIFKTGPRVAERPKAILFVGALIPRKGLSLLAEAWKVFHRDNPDWKLNIYGNGEPSDDLRRLDGAKIHPFVDPNDLPGLYARHRFLVLPSYDENWGLVVHEAVCCGCGVIASDAVGSTADLLTEDNGRVFKSGSAEGLREALLGMSNLNENALSRMDRINKQRRLKFGPKVWDARLESIIADLATESAQKGG